MFSSNAQDRRFRAGATVGLNLSQIDGDNYFGFDKLAYNGGVRVNAGLTKLTELQVEFLYSKRGSKSNKNDLIPFFVDLHYVEVPILFNVKDWINVESEDGGYYRMHFQGGFSVGRLINSSSTGNINEEFKETDVSWILGAAYFYRPNQALSLRYTSTFTPLYRYQNQGRDVKMVSYFISLNYIYMFL